MKPQIGIIGYAGLDEYPKNTRLNSKTFEYAYELGKLLGSKGYTIVTGGKSGVMESSFKGAKSVKALTVGVVTGDKRKTANQYTDVEVVSGMNTTGEEALLVTMCDAVIALGGGAGTLQEIAIAYRKQIPVIIIKGLGGWSEKLASFEFLDERMRQAFIFVDEPKQAAEIVSNIVSKGC